MNLKSCLTLHFAFGRIDLDFDTSENNARTPRHSISTVQSSPNWHNYHCRGNIVLVTSIDGRLLNIIPPKNTDHFTNHVGQGLCETYKIFLKN